MFSCHAVHNKVELRTVVEDLILANELLQGALLRALRAYRLEG